MDNPDIQKLLASLDRPDADPARAASGEVFAADIAASLPHMDEPTQLLIFQLLDDIKAAEVLAHADENVQAIVLGSLDQERLTRLFIEMEPDDAADLLAVAPDEARDGMLAELDDDARRSVAMLGEYEPESAGGIMTTDVVTVSSNSATDAALAKIGDDENSESMDSVFVVDNSGALVGVADVKSLLKAESPQTVGDVMSADVISIRADEDQEEAARLVDRYDITALPVVDDAGRLKGVITVDDIIDVLEEEASEDMLRLAGTGVTHPTSEPVLRRLRARAPWLAVTLAGTFVAALLIEYVERTWFEVGEGGDANFRALLYFIPLIGGMAGNVGSQSSTIMVRGFATGEVDPTRPMRVLRGELLLALLIGALSALLVGCGVALAHADSAWLGWAVGLALPCAIFVAALVGTLVPFACHRVGVDPAYAGGPFLLTLNDIAAFLIYFAVAIQLMKFLGIS
ncbi:MAG: magnesium transporter MgtE [Planctomycetota bacterium]|nr:MAG: magnesium transporter MgtE [Planctomycetota bacterium]